jgi:hypothetical protein
MKKQTVRESTPEHERFTKALTSVLAVKPGDLRESEAKDEPPSPHTRYKYDPEADRS